MAIRDRTDTTPAQREVVEGASLAAQREAGARARFFGALQRYPAFRRLWLGALALSVGQWTQQVGLGWLALTLTDSASFVGWVTFAAGVPFLVVAPVGGALIDRLDRRRLLLGCQALAAALALAVAADVIAGRVAPWHLPLVAFANGSLQAMLTPTQQSLVPGLVARADLANAIGLMSAGQNMTRVAGPSLAGVLIGWAGVGPAFLLQAAAVGVAFGLVYRLNLPRRDAVAAGPRGVFDGVRLIAARPDLRGLFLLACVPAFFAFPYIHFLSVFARDVLRIGASGLGLLMAASGTGAVIGSLLVAGRRSAASGRSVLLLTVVYGGVVVGIARSPSVWLSLPLLVGAGLLGSSFMSSNNVLLQQRIGDDVRGRVMGAYMLTFGLMPLGALPMGMVAERFDAPTAVAAGAIVSSLLTAWLGVSSRALRQLKAGADASPPAGGGHAERGVVGRRGQLLHGAGDLRFQLGREDGAGAPQFRQPTWQVRHRRHQGADLFSQPAAVPRPNPPSNLIERRRLHPQLVGQAGDVGAQLASQNRQGGNVVDRGAGGPDALDVGVPGQHEVEGGAGSRCPALRLLPHRRLVDRETVPEQQERFGGVEPAADAGSSETEVVEGGQQVLPDRDGQVVDRGQDRHRSRPFQRREEVPGGRRQQRHLLGADRGSDDPLPPPQHQVGQRIVGAEKDAWHQRGRRTDHPEQIGQEVAQPKQPLDDRGADLLGSGGLDRELGVGGLNGRLAPLGADQEEIGVLQSAAGRGGGHRRGVVKPDHPRNAQRLGRPGDRAVPADPA
ncbi:MAG: MFS transporter, partial [Chloroflexota bacterium]|nr:MFS transporter [Chloroflexota bacterium]